MNKKQVPSEPCELLARKIKEHDTITMCPYCKNLFDIHAGMIYLEGKQVDPPPKNTHEYFEKVME